MTFSRHCHFVLGLVRLLWTGGLLMLLSLALVGTLRAQTFPNVAQPGDIRVNGLSFGYAADPAFEDLTGSRSYTGPTLDHCASFAPVTVSLGGLSNVLDVSVNGTQRILDSSTPSTSVNVNLGFGDTTVAVTSRVSGGYNMAYSITVKRGAATSNADLANLAIAGTNLDTVFSSAVTGYTASVSASSIQLTPTTADCSSVTVNGVATTSGNPSSAVALNMGSNAISVVVTAQDGTVKTYTVTVTRSVSADASLSGLTLSSGILNPVFSGATLNYTASVANAVSSVTVTPTSTSGTAVLMVNGLSTANAGASGAIALNVGSNTLTVQSTAETGGASKTYTVTVTRAASGNSNLSALALSQGSLSPAFASGIANYTVSVASGVASLRVTPTAADATTSTTVNGIATASGAASMPIALSYGANTLTVVLTAQNDSVKIYTITVNRAAVSTNANLSTLLPSQGILTPVFDSATTGYVLQVDSSVASLQLTPTAADAGSSITVNGTALASGSLSVEIPVGVDSNTITVRVTASDGNTIKSYAVTALGYAIPASPLNDTGQASCYDGANLVPCIRENSGDAAAFPRQDGRFGRDALSGAGSLPKTGAGAGGFDFTRVCMSGQLAGQGACPASPVQGSNANEWACTRDNLTRLVWSLDGPSVSWSDATAVQAPTLNASARCGYSNGWRLPTLRELLSIVYSDAQNPSIDSAYFPSTASLKHWTADTQAGTAGSMGWYVHFSLGHTGDLVKTFAANARLVHSAP